MNLAVIGTGYVGLVSGVCFSDMGHTVVGIDIDENKINQLKQGQCCLYEPGLDEMFQRNVSLKRLSFSKDFSALKNAEAIFVAVGTPLDSEGKADLRYFYGAVESLIGEMKNGATIVIKSTVPVGTHRIVESFIKSKTKKSFYLANNPEFLKEGSAVEDFMKPDRVIIGCEEKTTADLMTKIYSPLIGDEHPLYIMSNLSAEMTKYAANCFLATKISFINEVANLCDLSGADIDEVRQGLSSDQRIGKHFLHPGLGFGGSCFPKDVVAFQAIAKSYRMELKIAKATENVNDRQKYRMIHKIKDHYGEDLKGKTFAFWGMAFKANTDDVRESSAIYLGKALLQAGCSIHCYDPMATTNYLEIMEQYGHDLTKIISFKDKFTCLENTDGLIVITEWEEFISADLKKIRELIKSPVVFDGRNIFDTTTVLSSGLNYYAVGKRIPSK